MDKKWEANLFLTSQWLMYNPEFTHNLLHVVVSQWMGPDLSMCFQGDIIFTASICIVAEILEGEDCPDIWSRKLQPQGFKRKAIQPPLKLGQKKSKRMQPKAAHDNNAQNQLSKTRERNKEVSDFKKGSLPANHFHILINRNVGGSFVIVRSKMAIGRSKPGIKAMPQGMELRLVAQVPRKHY